VQVIDDTKGVTLAAVHGREFPGALTKQEAAVGTEIAKRAIAKGVATVVFDRGGYPYAGQVKALADAALPFRYSKNIESGLKGRESR